MIFIVGIAQMGKSTLGVRNSHATLRDRIIASSYLGRPPRLRYYTMYNKKDMISAMSNNNVFANWLLDLTKDVKDDTSRVIRLDTHNTSRQEYLIFHTDSVPYKMLKAKEVAKLPEGHEQLLTEELSQDLVLSAEYSWVAEFKKATTGLTPDSLNFYRELNTHEHFYLCAGDYYSILSLNSPLSLITDTNSPLTYWVRREDDRTVVLGVGYLSDNQEVVFAINHRLVTLDFAGMPYIGLGEDAPTPASNYRSCCVTGDKITDYKLVTLGPISFDMSVTGKGNYTFPLTLDNNVVTDHLGKHGNFAFEFAPAMHMLTANRCFIDSITNIMLAPGPNLLSGGVNAQVISFLNVVQKKESIGIYTPMNAKSEINFEDPKSEKTPDAILSKVKEGHICGLALFEKLLKPQKMNFTTRNVDDRNDQYILFDDKYAYGNEYRFEKPNLSVAQIKQMSTNKLSLNSYVKTDDYNKYVKSSYQLKSQVKLSQFTPEDTIEYLRRF